MSVEPLKLKDNIIYGPVNSRRLGASLGVNILPHNYKACPFNCAYCQYGFTGVKGYDVEISRADLPAVDQIIEALEIALDKYPAVSYITLSGNGEPTIHPDFGLIVDAIKKVRDRFNPEIKTAILSNSALVFKDNIRSALNKLDCRFMKLDCGDEATFRRYNRPHRDISLKAIVDGLKKMDNITIQSLFTAGDFGNAGKESIRSWIERIGEIGPRECHIYSLDRPSADRRLIKLEKNELTAIKERTETQVGIAVRVY
jgi:wyosine [tRNA(Phe)-imidazoG37] synthetase (radical SAM superfamily)